MVMDETQQQQPSPQSVGREFVRQYYTLLNKAPNHLHRFYTNQSSFIHGESTLVIGQKNIYTRIQQLKFHDCHAKISQVDAQATLGNGVVVQVTGELSNDGQPMRRFTQTFVLGAQAPKKYYVHNDIFRYQDMYADEENDVESRSEIDEELEQPGSLNNVEAVAIGEQVQQPASLQQQQQPQTGVAAVINNAPGIAAVQAPQPAGPPQQTIYYSMPTTAATVAGVSGRPLHMHQAPPSAIAGAPATVAGTPYVAGVMPPQAAALNQLNGVGGHDDMAIAQQAPQPTGLVQTPVSGVLTVLGAQTAATVPLANTAALPLNNAPSGGQVAGFQASTVLPPPQQQQQQTVTIMSQQQGGQQHLHLQQSAETLHDSHSTYNANNTETNVMVNDFKTINEQQQQEKYEAAKHQLQSEPKTYANLFKTTTSSPSGFVNAAMQQQQQFQQQQQQQHQLQNNHNINSNNGNSTNSSSLYQSQNNTSTYSQNSNSSNGNNNGNNMYNNRNNDNGSMHHRMDNNGGNMLGGQNSLPQRPNARMNKDFDQRRSSNTLSDSHQLFVRNLPPNTSEDELKLFFQKFGNVMDLKIMPKGAGGKIMPGIRNPTCYCFVTYDDPESVHNCLSKTPLYFPENSPDALKLNVEEKKPRSMPRQGGMGNNINSMNNNQRNISGGPQSRSMSGTGGGLMRGGNSGNMSGSGGGAGGNNMSRGANSGGRINNYRNSAANGGGGSQLRGGNNSVQSGGSNYGSRR